jgi:FAD/FMN-containing dehydrogenase/Fe-S oxidoreductase
MKHASINKSLKTLSGQLDGVLSLDHAARLLYATDASAYREIPMAVCWPASETDLLKLLDFARENSCTIIPRGAGTSLAGQVVGNGIVVDFSRFFTKVLEINADEKWVRVQPGVVLDELNLQLKYSGYFFAPETSTSNRCVMGGMIGNNSSGLRSLIYGTTREHLLSVKAILSDGSITEFGELDHDEFQAKCRLQSLEGNIYRNISEVFMDQSNLDLIDADYPDKRIIRRNTGYALDELSDCYFFRKDSQKKFNFCKLLAGSEGTLALITEAKLQLTQLPPAVKGLVCAHFNTVMEAIRGNLLVLEENPSAVELMDKKILDCTLENIEQRKNRFFIEGDPGAILMIEFFGDSIEEIHQKAFSLEKKLRWAGLGYHFPLVTGENIRRVWELRKSGLGVLSNMPGDARPVSVIEDTSVHPEQLVSYITDFNEILEKYNKECVYHAHISVGELHLRPVLDLKKSEDVILFRKIATETAQLVKKYRGSLSGEHGDGRLRGEFIPIIYNEKIYQWFRELKDVWDPDKLLNNQKIIDTPPMDRFLRYEADQPTREITTYFDFSESEGIVRAAERCNGSGDCRKSELMGGTMCPSYMATKDESTSTRARANILREFLTNSTKKNPFDHKEIYDILDLCLSCKACKSECPSNVDMAKLKAEFLQHYQDKNGISLRTRAIAYISRINGIASISPAIFNFFAQNRLTSWVIKRSIGFAQQRNIPALHSFTLRTWVKNNVSSLNSGLPEDAPALHLFIDEFTNFNDTQVGIKAILLLNRLGYRVYTRDHEESGRSFLSKGLLRKAEVLARRNVSLFSQIINERMPLVGIEPSAILAFRDEYPDLLRGKLKEKALQLAKNTFTIDEFLAMEMDAGSIKKEMFTDVPMKIKLHGHCQQKAIASTRHALKILGFPANYEVNEIKSGCCGMAGSFGYEKEHYDLSMKVGELVLFPEIRKTGEEIKISAPGTSCRVQIKDGTGREAVHPVEILFEAVKDLKKI